MKMIHQTLYGKEEGNCFQACVASILEMHLWDVPHFCRDYPDDWLIKCNDWLSQYGLGLVFIDFTNDSDDHISLFLKHFCHGYHIGGITSPRGIKHAVVVKDGIIVHDPHPSQDGLNGKLEDIQLFTIANASLINLSINLDK